MDDNKQRSWWSRNWPWVVPVGGCLILIILGILGIGGLIFGVTSMIKNSAPYEYALEQAKQNEDVIYALGEPIETNGIMQGNLSFENDNGEVDIRIPIKGPMGEADIIVVGEKYDGEWSYEKLYVLIKETQEEINLLEKVLERI
ncbi:MAG: cytochrome c oxidase assembly factor Coa1 family protein [Bacteroidota bacterium]